MLALSHIQKTFHQGDADLHVLRDVSLTVKAGEKVALVGPSGCGKTTLLHIAGLLDVPSSGEVIIHDTVCNSLSDRERTQLRREQIGVVYQFHHLLPEFTALENVMMPLLLSAVSRKEATEKAEHMLTLLGLQDRLQHQPSALSGGEQQRVAIARALVHGPSLLLADEPTGNLDPHTSEYVFNAMLDAMMQTHCAAFIVTHNHELAQRLDRVITLDEGKVVEEG